MESHVMKEPHAKCEEIIKSPAAVPVESEIPSELLPFESVVIKQEQDNEPEESCSLENSDCKLENEYNSSFGIHLLAEPASVSSHGSDEKHEFVCTICQKGFAKNCSLVCHMRNHSGEQPFECEVCQERFSQKHNLSEHLKTHSSEKPFVCELCDRTFVLKSYLIEHARKHNKEKPWKCEICNSSFMRRNTLRNHKLKHTGAPKVLMRKRV